MRSRHDEQINKNAGHRHCGMDNGAIKYNHYTKRKYKWNQTSSEKYFKKIPKTKVLGIFSSSFFFFLNESA